MILSEYIFRLRVGIFSSLLTECMRSSHVILSLFLKLRVAAIFIVYNRNVCWTEPNHLVFENGLFGLAFSSDFHWFYFGATNIAFIKWSCRRYSSSFHVQSEDF